MPTKTMINNIDVDAIRETIDAVKSDPSIAKFRFRAKNRWVDGAHNQTTINDFDGANQTFSRDKSFVFEKDEPPILLGNDIGANPVEYVLAALAGCLTTSLILHAAAKGYTITEVESQLEGELDLRGFLGIDDSIRNGYQNISITFKIKGDVPEETYEELIEIAKARSPVFDIVSHPVSINVALEK